jgi:hypothetical protein
LKLTPDIVNDVNDMVEVDRSERVIPVHKTNAILSLSVLILIPLLLAIVAHSITNSILASSNDLWRYNQTVDLAEDMRLAAEKDVALGQNYIEYRNEKMTVSRNEWIRKHQTLIFIKKHGISPIVVFLVTFLSIYLIQRKRKKRKLAELLIHS